MTDEQVETLRKQIAVYTYISEQLIQRHTHSSSRQHLTNGARMRMFCDSRLIDKLSSKQRWKPTISQVQALEKIYAANPEAPNKETIKKITVDLSEHGKISESNVYNWFQNRRARSKKKKHSNVDAKSKVDSKDKIPKLNESDENLGHQNSPENSDFLPYFNLELDESFAIL
ncbi:WUSCHEL-related homeobox 8 [Lathyrus oleraceus]|nr:WUSCHEL-related homeobox 8-like [Pisum sativum]